MAIVHGCVTRPDVSIRLWTILFSLLKAKFRFNFPYLAKHTARFQVKQMSSGASALVNVKVREHPPR